MATVRARRRKPKEIAGALTLAKQVKKFPASELWLDFDEEADVLYISFKRPQKATETVEFEEKGEDQGILLHYRKEELVGITVLDATKR